MPEFIQRTSESTALTNKRVGRKEYALFLIFFFIFQMLRGVLKYFEREAFLAGSYDVASHLSGIGAFLWLASWPFWIFFLRAGVRRLHDISRKGWWILLPLGAHLLVMGYLPHLIQSLVSPVAIVAANASAWIGYVVLACIRPAHGRNRYGTALVDEPVGEAPEQRPKQVSSKKSAWRSWWLYPAHCAVLFLVIGCMTDFRNILSDSSFFTIGVLGLALALAGWQWLLRPAWSAFLRGFVHYREDRPEKSICYFLIGIALCSIWVTLAWLMLHEMTGYGSEAFWGAVVWFGCCVFLNQLTEGKTGLIAGNQSPCAPEERREDAACLNVALSREGRAREVAPVAVPRSKERLRRRSRRRAGWLWSSGVAAVFLIVLAVWLAASEEKQDQLVASVSPCTSQELRNAILSGREDAVIRCLNRGASADALVELGDETNYARLLEQLKETTRFIRGDSLGSPQGPRPTTIRARLVPALCLAATVGNRNLVEALARRAISVDAKTPEGLTAFQIAVLSGKRDVAACLLDRGAEAGRSYPGGLNAAEGLAAAFGEEKPLRDMLLLLIRHGLDPNMTIAQNITEQDKQAILQTVGNQWATQMGDKDLANIVREHIHDESSQYVQKMPSDFSMSLLHMAAHAGWMDVVEELCRRGAVIQGEGAYAGTPMHRACAAGYGDIVNFLLDRGGHVNARTREGWTLLHRACAEGHVEIARDLIRRGIDIDAQTNYGGSALHLAVLKRRAPIVDLLVRSRADLEIRNRDGATPLALALITSDLESMKILLNNGANLAAVFPNGLPCVALAIENEKVWAYLRDHVFPTPILRPSVENDAVGRLLIDKATECADADIRFKLYYCAAMLGNWAAVEQVSVCYAKGHGCPVSTAQASHWAAIAGIMREKMK